MGEKSGRTMAFPFREAASVKEEDSFVITKESSAKDESAIMFTKGILIPASEPYSITNF
jgi:hypothetical protein